MQRLGAAATPAAGQLPVTLAVLPDNWTSPSARLVWMWAVGSTPLPNSSYADAAWLDWSQPRGYYLPVENVTGTYFVRANDRFGNAQVRRATGLWACHIVRGEHLIGQA